MQSGRHIALLRRHLRTPPTQPSSCPSGSQASPGALTDKITLDYVDSRGLSSRMTGRKEPFAMVEL
jgi:hypothetical protein